MRKAIITAALAIVSIGLGAAAPSEGDHETPDAKLTAGSVWTGVVHPDDRQAFGKTFPARLRIVSRDGKTFEVKFAQESKGRPTVEAKGEVDDAGNLRFKPTEVTGTWGPHVLDKVWLGQVKGDKLACKIVDEATGEKSQGREVDLTLKQ